MIEEKSKKPVLCYPNENKIRSFTKRTGRLSKGQSLAIEKFKEHFCISYEEKIVNLPEIFGRCVPTILEIGFGMGEASAKIASDMPEKNFLGVEVHTPGIGNLLKLIDEKKIDNLRIIQYDAVKILDNMISPKSLAGVHIFFPDPWHKVRHNKRRLIQQPLVSLLCSRIMPGGYLHCATDWLEYAEQMLETLEDEPSLRNTSEYYTERPDYRPITKFEKRGLKLGHGIWDLLFKRV